MSGQFSNPYSSSPQQNGPQPSDETLVPAEMVAALPRVGRPLLAWLLIVTLVATMLTLSRSGAEHEHQPQAENNSAGFALDMQGRYLVGLASMPMIDSHRRDDIYQQAQEFNRGPIGQRLCFIALAGELKGPEEAFEHLDALLDLLGQRSIELSDRQQALCDSYELLYGDYMQEHWQAPSLDDKQRRQLRSELGWFGQLALAPLV